MLHLADLMRTCWVFSVVQNHASHCLSTISIPKRFKTASKWRALFDLYQSASKQTLYYKTRVATKAYFSAYIRSNGCFSVPTHSSLKLVFQIAFFLLELQQIHTQCFCGWHHTSCFIVNLTPSGNIGMNTGDLRHRVYPVRRRTSAEQLFVGRKDDLWRFRLAQTTYEGHNVTTATQIHIN